MTEPEIATPLEREVAAQAAQVLAEKKVRFTDRRLLVLYLALTLAIMVFLTMFARQERAAEESNRQFQHAITGVCTDLEESHTRINQLLDQLATSASTRPDRTPEQKAETAKVYQGLKLADLKCPSE
jgi:uncharacterized protein HemX